jgi:hypothetical protein
VVIAFTNEEIEMYKKILDKTAMSLDWIYGNSPFPKDSFDNSMNQNGYSVDTHRIRLQLELWKKTHTLIAHFGESPLPPCKYIVPT